MATPFGIVTNSIIECMVEGTQDKRRLNMIQIGQIVRDSERLKQDLVHKDDLKKITDTRELWRNNCVS